MRSSTRDRIRGVVAREAAPVVIGRVVKVSGLLVEVTLDGIRLGEQLEIIDDDRSLLCELSLIHI